MKCPPGKQPLLVDENGFAWPLIVPEAMLEKARELYGDLWIEANPKLEIPK